ncbi:ABC transporter ATP-binding protein [Megasphaera hominis]|jgi:phospholipid/cholesterol/gamma-HCH transport system ATP-binding protein|uniref:ABC transporter ATP-binding protein n=1 Tax=Megasphaera hominis TaxID=159836 RepID=A0ABR6VFI8_9FIRM|nr:ABC transporter ATP-binding protein [Megasphaera hominis]MBC3535894.1 ABC transporter ATP-binding protein [Megasphaera hominis]
MISLQDITVAYGSRVILNHINLDIHTGETLAILGASGSGKSTILRLIIGLQKPTSGKIFVDGQDILALDEDQMDQVRLHMGMVFQYSALFDSMSVGENVAFGLRQHTKKSEEEIREIVHNKLHLVGLDNVEAMMPNNLSGGMKKRVSLARAIALEPQVILYDEPTAGLDPLRSMDINHLIVNTQRQLHTTSVVVTHDMESAFYVADRLAYLEEGEFRLIADKETFRSTTDAQVQRFIHGSTDWQEGGNTT